MKSSLLVTSSLLALTTVLASPVSNDNCASRPHESVSRLPLGWSFHSESTGDESITLKIALKKASNKISEIAHAVSDPSASRYGKHLSAEELEHITTKGSIKACDAIQSWLDSHDLYQTSCDGNYAHFTSSVDKANKMLGSNFGLYQLDDLEPVLRTTEYSLPAHVSEHIDFVFPTVHFLTGGRKPKHVQSLEARQHGIPTGPATCANSICPQNLTEKYNITYFPKDGKSGSKIGITGFIDNFPNKTDVQSFFTKYGSKSKTQPPTYNVVSINNGTTKTPPPGSVLDVEPNLDLDYSLAFTGPLPATFYSVGGRPPKLSQPGNKSVPVSENDNEPYLEFFTALLKEKNPPQVISISYSDDEQSVPIKYAQHVCDLMAQAAARGISIIGSSGDGGAEGTGNSDCLGPNGEHRFIPTFPSSCPWQTSVGATAVYGGPATYSSGGFSNYFATPSWQKSATKQYIKELDGKHAKYYNASGRGIPDVSLLGDNYLILSGGVASPQKGTSASTPLFAAMIALVNDLRLRAGKPVLGHLNPVLYSEKLSKVFTDSVSEFGTSRGCTWGDETEGGWEALAGWDAATGLGEPDFAQLKDALVQI